MNPFEQMIVNWIEATWPGSKPIIDLLLPYLGNVNVADLLLKVIKDYQSGMNFYQILVDVLTGSGSVPPDVVASAKNMAASAAA